MVPAPVNGIKVMSKILEYCRVNGLVGTRFVRVWLPNLQPYNSERAECKDSSFQQTLVFVLEDIKLLRGCQHTQ